MPGGGAAAGITAVEITQDYPISKRFKEFGNIIHEAFKNQPITNTVTTDAVDEKLFKDLWDKIKQFFSSISDYVSNYASSTGDAIKNIYNTAQTITKRDLETLYGQLKKWATVLSSKSEEVKKLIAEIWNHRTDIVSKIFNTVYQHWDKLSKIMETVNKNIAEWVQMAINVANDFGGWEHVVDYLKKNINRWDQWIDTIGSKWETYSQVLETIVKQWDNLWKQKEKLCKDKEQVCKEAWGKIFEKLTEKGEQIFQKLGEDSKKLTWELLNLAQEMSQNVSTWQGILEKHKDSIPVFIDKLFENDNWNNAKELLQESNLKNVKNIWSMLSNVDSLSPKVIKVKEDLREIFFEQFMEKFKDDPKNAIDAVKQLGEVLSQDSQPAAQGSWGSTSTIVEPVEINKDIFKHLWNVKPGASLSLYLSSLKTFSDLGLPLNDTTALFSRVGSNLLGLL